MPLDIGVGILISIFVSHVFHISLTPTLLLLGIVAALLPDIDIVTMLWGRWQHRELTHYPIVYIPVIIAVCCIFGLPYAALLFLGVYIHLIHDTIGIGWGISWFWPFTKRRFLFLPEEGRRKRYGWFMTWLPEEQKNIVEEPTKHNWVVTYYLRPSTLGFVEYGLFVFSLIILFYFRYIL